MYDLRQFKPALYLLLLLGISGFALAAQSPLIWVFGAGGLALNAYLVWHGQFKAMPRMISNLVTIAALVYVIHNIFVGGGTPVLVIGQFLVLLQVVKAWEQRGNRDFAQLLVLSLLLMVAASIDTASLAFGVLLVAYLFLSLYCCLLFHLKVETDNARAAMIAPELRVSETTLRQDQRHLTGSMRKLTGLVSLVSILFAVATFILFPRGTGAGLLGPMQFKAAQSLVGFGTEVNFQGIARIQQNTAVVASVGVLRNRKEVTSGPPLLLRGLTYDRYTGDGKQGEGMWRWVRTESVTEGSDGGVTVQRDAREPLRFVPDDESQSELWEQHIRLKPTGTDVLFAMGGAMRIQPRRTLRVRYSNHDGVLEAPDMPSEEFEYVVVSTNQLGNADPLPGSGTPPENIDPKITQYARQPQVSGSNAQGPLAAQRKKTQDPDPLDEQIAANIERHLKTRFAYTLDLTDTRRIEGRDPLVAFLYDFKKGHCEYFAGAMTLMCQSLGMQARMVAGFHCDEFNSTPGARYYTVRQSHAHAWVEVRTPSGWKTFDPTSDRDAAQQAAQAGPWQNVRHFFEFLEYTYANAIIAYSNEDRDNLIQKTESAMLAATARSAPRISRFAKASFKDWRHTPIFWKISSAVLFIAMGSIAMIALSLLVRYAWQTWRLRRRAARIGIGSLPEDEQLRLARQLGFYDDLLTLLGRHQISRPRHQTPLEFSRSLLFLPAGPYDTVRRLTELFYRVRYGRAQLTPRRRRHLREVIARLESELNGASRSTAFRP